MTQRPLADPDRGLQLIPDAVSDYAGEVDQLYFVLLALSSVLTLTVIGLVLVFGFRYRRGRSGGRGPTPSKRGGHYLEIGFAASLGLVFLLLFVWAGRLYLELHTAERDALVINVIGKQWMWKAQHPDGTREINTLHVPVNETIQLRLTSQDVIHSFSLPALRLKKDAVPGRYNEVSFKATRTGEYRLFCAEFCGLDHSRMRGKVVVMTPTDYQHWLEGTQGTDPVAAGEQLFDRHGCADCHQSGDGAPAPNLAGIVGRTVLLQNGNRVTADEEYLRRSILTPQRQVVAGYAPIMPSFSGQLSESEILNIIAYLSSLSAQPEDSSSIGEGP